MSVFMGNGNHYEGLSKVRNIEDVIALLSLPQSLLDQPVGTQFLYFQVDPTKAELTIDAAFLFEVVDKNG
jgi:hypothetical protein